MKRKNIAEKSTLKPGSDIQIGTMVLLTHEGVSGTVTAFFEQLARFEVHCSDGLFRIVKPEHVSELPRPSVKQTVYENIGILRLVDRIIAQDFSLFEHDKFDLLRIRIQLKNMQVCMKEYAEKQGDIYDMIGSSMDINTWDDEGVHVSLYRVDHDGKSDQIHTEDPLTLF